METGGAWRPLARQWDSGSGKDHASKKKVENSRRSLIPEANLWPLHAHSQESAHMNTPIHPQYTQTRDWAKQENWVSPQKGWMMELWCELVLKTKKWYERRPYIFPLLHRAGCLFLHHIRSHPRASLSRMPALRDLDYCNFILRARVFCGVCV